MLYWCRTFIPNESSSFEMKFPFFVVDMVCLPWVTPNASFLFACLNSLTLSWSNTSPRYVACLRTISIVPIFDLRLDVTRSFSSEANLGNAKRYSRTPFSSKKPWLVLMQKVYTQVVIMLHLVACIILLYQQVRVKPQVCLVKKLGSNHKYPWLKTQFYQH